MPYTEADISRHFKGTIETLHKVKDTLMPDIIHTAGLIADRLRQGNKILIAGNGGSAADAQHMAAELIVRLSKSKNRAALPAIALTTDTSILTAAGNDIGFENIFSRQIEGLGNEGDIFFAISTSGNSPNMIRAAEVAVTKKMNVIALCGHNGGLLVPKAHIALIVPSENTAYIQEAHICIYHIICESVEDQLFG